MTRATDLPSSPHPDEADAAQQPPRKVPARKPRAPKATPAKKAPAKAAPTAKATPGPTAQAAPVVRAEPTAPSSTTHRPPAPHPETDRWAKLLADPAHAPELLALAAVETIGPRAHRWATTIQAAYPTATSAGLARLATRQFTRFGALTSIFGAVAGSYAAMALVATRALTDTELILHLAAAHGLDPRHPDRAVDLLVITGVHDTAAEAESALAATRGPEPTASGLSDAAWRIGRLFVARSGRWTALRVINRYYPGVSLLGAVLTSAADAQATAARALTYFRGGGSGPGQSQVSQEDGSAS